MTRHRFESPEQHAARLASKTSSTSIVVPTAYLKAIDQIIHLEWEISSHERRVSRLLQSRSAFIVEMIESAIFNWCRIMADTFEPKDNAGEQLYERIPAIIDALPYHLRDRCKAALEKHMDGNPVERMQVLLDQVHLDK